MMICSPQPIIAGEVRLSKRQQASKNKVHKWRMLFFKQQPKNPLMHPLSQSKLSWVKIFINLSRSYFAPRIKSLEEWKINSRNRRAVRQADMGGRFWQNRTASTAEGKLWLNVASRTPPKKHTPAFSTSTGCEENTSPEFFVSQKLPERKTKHKLWPEQQYMSPLLIFHDSLLHWRASVWTHPICCSWVRHKCESYIPVGFVLAHYTSVCPLRFLVCSFSLPVSQTLSVLLLSASWIFSVTLFGCLAFS